MYIFEGESRKKREEDKEDTTCQEKKRGLCLAISRIFNFYLNHYLLLLFEHIIIIINLLI